jgi:hypothetical protein
MSKRKLTVDDLRLLGRFYQNDLQFEIEIAGQTVRLVPPRSTWLSLSISISINSAAFFGLLYIAYTFKVADFGPLIWLVLIIAGILAIGGPLLAQILRLKYLERNSPLIEGNQHTKTVSILCGAHTFVIDDIHCLLGLCLRDSHGVSKSELQLIVKTANGFEPHLIATTLSGNVRKSYAVVMSEFGNLMNIRTMIAEPTGVLGGGDVAIASLTNDQ